MKKMLTNARALAPVFSPEAEMPLCLYDYVCRYFLLVMATILRLPYTMAIAPYAQGGLLYGLLYYGQVSARPRVL